MLITDFRINSALTFPWPCKDMTAGIAHTCVEVRNLTGSYKNSYLHQEISSLMTGSSFVSPHFSSNAIGTLLQSKKKQLANLSLNIVSTGVTEIVPRLLRATEPFWSCLDHLLAIAITFVCLRITSWEKKKSYHLLLFYI